MAALSVLFISTISTIFAAQTRIDAGLPPMFGGRIKHVIAIMLENRSFDHMLGFQRANRTNIDGCLPSLGVNCSNPIDPTDANSDIVYVNDAAIYVQPGDPDHSVAGTSLQVYNKYGDNTEYYYPAPMKGFIKSYSTRDKSMNDSGAFIMKCFNDTTLPILNTLSEEFAVIDHWFAAVPGPTEPNRIFSMMGTSQGMAENYDPKLIEGFIGPNIFHMIDEYAPNNLTNTPPQKWRSYFQDSPTSGFLNYVRAHPEHARDVQMLYDDMENGTLPIYSWIDPAYFDIDPVNRASDEHPDHDVTKGEQLLKDIYEHLRKSPRWNDTLLFIYYDEHGGFFDHVPPPNCPNPDGLNSTHVKPPFMFNRLGVRVPAVLVSPWIKKGTVGKKPMEGEPQYCHSSLIRTMREQFAPTSPSLSKREEWALTFDDLINLDEPRTDCPLTLPAIPKSSYDHIDWIPGQQPNNEYQINIAKSAAFMCGRQDELEQHLDNQASLGLFVKDCVTQWMSENE